MKPEEVLAGIESFADARVVGELAGGPASDSYLVERDAERFVLRIDTAVAAALGLDRAAEVEVLAFVSQNSLAPMLEFGDPERGILVTRYVDGRAWTGTDLRDADRIRNLAELLRRLHALEPLGCPLNLHGKVDNYARIIGTAEGRKLAEDTQQFVRELDDPAVPPCLCHNDLISANIIEGQALVLIDWEYAAIGDPMFDLAIVAEHHRFDQELASGLLNAYFGEVRAEDTRRLSRYRSLYKRLLVLWLASVEQLCEIGVQQQIRLQQAWSRLNESGTL